MEARMGDSANENLAQFAVKQLNEIMIGTLTNNGVTI